VAIGQLDNAFTPLQIVNYISALANGGKLYKPHVIKKVVKYDGSIVNETKPTYEQIPVKPEYISAVKDGMIRVTQSTDGTAQKYFKGLPFEVAGKTGTAQTGKEATHSSNALFVCYAPADKPQIAIAVVVEKGAWGSNTAPIARDLIDEYFGLKKADTATSVLAPEQPVFTP
jgi:penicillin-binding protein 2